MNGSWPSSWGVRWGFQMEDSCARRDWGRQPCVPSRKHLPWSSEDQTESVFLATLLSVCPQP